MMKETQYGVSQNVLYDSRYKAIPVTIDAEQVTAVEGKKLVPAGTLILGVDGSVFDNRDSKAQPTSATGEIDGVLLHDVDVTDGDAIAAIVYAGSIWANKVNPSVTANVRTKLNQIKFITE